MLENPYTTLKKTLQIVTQLDLEPNPIFANKPVFITIAHKKYYCSTGTSKLGERVTYLFGRYRKLVVYIIYT